MWKRHTSIGCPSHWPWSGPGIQPCNKAHTLDKTRDWRGPFSQQALSTEPNRLGLRTLFTFSFHQASMWSHWMWSWKEMRAIAYHFMVSPPKIKNNFILKYWLSNNQLAKIPKTFNNLFLQISTSCPQHTSGCNYQYVLY